MLGLRPRVDRRQDICCIKNQVICCSSRKPNRHVNEISGNQGGDAFGAHPRVWWMRLRYPATFPAEAADSVFVQQRTFEFPAKADFRVFFQRTKNPKMMGLLV